MKEEKGEEKERKKIDITGEKFWYVGGAERITLLDKREDATEELKERVDKGESLGDLLVLWIKVGEEEKEGELHVKLDGDQLSWREIAEVLAEKRKEVGEEE